MRRIQAHDRNDAEQVSAWILFDVREPEQCRLLHQARGIWQADSDIEPLDEHHFAFIIKFAEARRTTA